MTTRIAILSQKGGVGKTTVSLNLALAFAERGKRTLLVDLDPQGGIGLSLAKGDAELVGLADLLSGTVEAKDAITKTRVPYLSLLARGRLDPVDVCSFQAAIFENGLLGDVLNEVDEQMDLTLIDTPSGLGMITRSAMRAADYGLIPFQAEPMALRSTGQVLRVIEEVAKTENPKLKLLGILPTMVDRYSEPSQSVMAELWTGFDAVLDTTVPRAGVFQTASLEGVPVGLLGGKISPEARRFDVLAAEVEVRMQQMSLPGDEHAERPTRSLL